MDAINLWFFAIFAKKSSEQSKIPLFLSEGWTWTGDFKCREVKTGFCRNISMQTGSSGTLIGWKSGQTTFVPLWDWMEGAWLRTLKDFSHFDTYRTIGSPTFLVRSWKLIDMLVRYFDSCFLVPWTNCFCQCLVRKLSEFYRKCPPLLSRVQLKGLSHEIDFKNLDKKLQNLT